MRRYPFPVKWDVNYLDDTNHRTCCIVQGTHYEWGEDFLIVYEGDWEVGRFPVKKVSSIKRWYLT